MPHPNFSDFGAAPGGCAATVPRWPPSLSRDYPRSVAPQLFACFRSGGPGIPSSTGRRSQRPRLVCVCVHIAPGTWPSAQFDCLDLGLAVCRSFRVAAGLLTVLVVSPSPSLLCPGARDFFDFLCPCLCSAASLGVVAELFRLLSLSCIDDAEARMLLKQLWLLLDSSLFRIFWLVLCWCAVLGLKHGETWW